MQAVPYLMAAGAALSTVQQVNTANYQAAVAANNAAIATENAQRETLAANKDMAARDRDAAAALADLTAQMNASGINSSNGTKMLQRRSLEQLATTDRENLAAKRDANLENRLQEAASYSAESKAYKRGATMSLLTGMLSVPTSYLSGASMVGNYNKLVLNRSKDTIYPG